MTILLGLDRKGKKGKRKKKQEINIRYLRLLSAGTGGDARFYSPAFY